MEVMTIPTNHRKPIHTIRFYTGSDYVEPDHDGFNLFLTAACDNLINIYDIRSSQPVGSLLGHTNTGLSLGANISPCMRYIASGSEDRSAYIWDTRTNQIIQRLRGFRENTNDVA